jgi:hypothetical protein
VPDNLFTGIINNQLPNYFNTRYFSHKNSKIISQKKWAKKNPKKNFQNKIPKFFFKLLCPTSYACNRKKTFPKKIPKKNVQIIFLK